MKISLQKYTYFVVVFFTNSITEPNPHKTVISLQNENM